MTELRWHGKFKESGKRVAPERICLPLRTVEQVESFLSEPQTTLEMMENDEECEWRSRLILGDKKIVLPSLLPEFAGKVNLIYIDPPFDTGSKFTYATKIPRHRDTKIADQQSIEQTAYSDVWGKGLDSYLQWFYETIVLLRELLAENGSIYVHLDWHVSHYAKAILDEVFGAECFQNEIAWCYREAINSTKRWNRKHDNILFYTRHPVNFVFNENAVLQPHSDSTIAKYKYQDEKGRYRLMGRGITGSPICSARDVAPEWERTHPELVFRHYLREGSYAMDYWNIDIINQAAHERLNYPTQKPEALLERILKASSNEGDLVLDCFCGSGTTAATAEKTGRRWITCDEMKYAIQTTRKRLLGIPDVKPFIIQNSGIIEEQTGQSVEGAAEARGEAFVEGKTVTLLLMDYRIPENSVPTEMRKSKTHWSQWIDYWAIDWNSSGAIFMNEWRSFRTRKEKEIKLEAAHSYKQSGSYTIDAHIIDILGNESSITVNVNIEE